MCVCGEGSARPRACARPAPVSPLPQPMARGRGGRCVPRAHFRYLSPRRPESVRRRTGVLLPSPPLPSPHRPPPRRPLTAPGGCCPPWPRLAASRARRPAGPTAERSRGRGGACPTRTRTRCAHGRRAASPPARGPAVMHGIASGATRPPSPAVRRLPVSRPGLRGPRRGGGEAVGARPGDAPASLTRWRLS